MIYLINYKKKIGNKATKLIRHLLIYITVMYRDTKLVILNFCAFDLFSILNEGSKNLNEQ